MRLIIAGSRDIPPDYVFDYLEHQTHFNRVVTEVICGLAKGPDLAGKHWAEVQNKRGFHIFVKEFPADWDKYKKAAGYIRNIEMAKYADELIAFWDGKSRGTRHMIQMMLDLNKPFQVILIRP